MDLPIRILKVLGGIAAGFIGYFLMAAEGWGEPLESMLAGRLIIGSLIALLGLALIWSAFRPAARSRRTADYSPRPDFKPEFSPEPQPPAAEPFNLAPLAAAAAPVAVAETLDAPEDEAANDAESVADPEPEPATALAAPEPEPTALPDDFSALMAKGDKLAAEGRSDEALEPYSEATALAKGAYAVHPSPEATRALAGALKSTGDAYDDQGRLEAAIDHYEEALKLNRSLATSGSPTDRRALSLTLERLADCREARGHRSRAADLYRESLQIAEGLAKEDPQNPLYAQDLSATQHRLEELEAAATPV